MSLNNLTICQAHQGLKKKEFSVKELTQACLSEIKKKDKKINAFIRVLKDQALKQAQEIDKKISSQGLKSFLTGIPLGIKDNILIKDVVCTAGSKILKNYQASYDATVIKKLKQLNVIFLGKTNLDEFAMGASTETSGFGPTKNPHNLKCVPGGSSGGSAAALTAKMCLGALGSDTGGSVRQPASFCGVVGLKPTYGRVSRYGLIAMASSLDQIGSLARSVDDAAILLQAIEGPDYLDSTSVDLKFPVDVRSLVRSDLTKNLKNFKIGVPKEYFIKGLEAQIKEKIDKLIKKLGDEGAEIVEVSLPHTKYALACYYIIMPAEVSANLARYDGIKYGLSSIEKSTSLLDVYLDSRTQGFGDEVRRRIMLGTYTLSAGYYQAYYLKAQKVRTLIKEDFDKVFAKKKIDCLITPTAPTPAWKLGEKIDDPLSMYLADVYTVSVNLAGLPAISLPVGKVNDLPAGQAGLPVGVQLIGNYFKENKILQIAKVVEGIDKI
ncbi:Asp-tRNA(Asn)/Glu-tRNA(Gln) amidotransferase subunit GatA [Patescibacteria group bacterium]|nr:Asp-tRNA(Asn)/Glu-tRNA(Gln) amidotransferase subunit GatA [Patescibacteria group bacterium]